MKLNIGDLIQPTENMRRFGWNKVAIIIGIYGGRYRVMFPDGETVTFHPRHLKPDK